MSTTKVLLGALAVVALGAGALATVISSDVASRDARQRARALSDAQTGALEGNATQKAGVSQ